MESEARPGDAPLRHELKMTCQEAGYARVLMALRLHRAGVRRLHPPRRVQSIYFDSPFGRALEENVAGISHREKLRFRWYGDDARAVRGQLERKVRENSLGWKETAHLDEPVGVEGAPRHAFTREVAARVEAAGHARLASDLGAGLEPVQWITYLREYHATHDGTVRVTIDRELTAFDQRLRARLARRDPSPSPRLLVVEAKCAPEHLSLARDLVGHLPLAVGRCSKFVLASTRGHGPLPSVLED